jgi:hypothetical protein
MSKTLTDLQKEVYETVKNNGFYIKWNRARNILRRHGSGKLCLTYFIAQEYLIDLSEFDLMHSEISEASEEIRNKDREKAIIELAGLVIRVLCYCENQGFNLEKYIISENKRNKTRKMYHSRIVI